MEVRTEILTEILRLKNEKNALLLAHYYQDSQIQDIADAVGDSLELARFAQSAQNPVIVFCGVDFMAEGAKLLNPNAKVILPDANAGCSLAHSCPPETFKSWKESFQNPFVISYINSSAAIKALSDVICTSSNAEKIVARAPNDRPLLFGPDRNLGRYLSKKLKREMHIWPGSCIVHETFSLQKLLLLKEKHPEAIILAHPECPEDLLEVAHIIGSTSALIKATYELPNEKFIVATEAGILHKMQTRSPNKIFLPAPPTRGCQCNECPYMKLNTLEKIRTALESGGPEVHIPKNLIAPATKALQTMMEWS